MNTAEKAAVLILLTAFIAGCRHKAKTAPPPAAQAPVLPISQLEKSLPPPQLPPVKAPKITPPTLAKATNPNPKKTTHRKPRHTETTPAEQVPAKDQTTSQSTSATQQSSSSAPSDISPIGQLSAAGESTNTPKRQEILDEINSTEKGLNDIKRTLSKDEQLTAAQARTFLTKAKDALNQEDLDGAHTLVTKAKVLLDELTKQ